MKWKSGTSRYVQGQMDTTLEYGWLQVTVRPGTSRYSDRLLEKYFNVKMTPMDAYSRDSVISIENFLPLLICKDFGGKRVTSFKLSTLSPTFLKQLQEYERAIIGVQT